MQLWQSGGGFSACLLGIAMSLHSHHHGFRAGTCENTHSPASRTSLLVPAGGVWQHPQLGAGGQRPAGFSSSKFLLLQEEEASPQANCGLVGLRLTL